MWPALPHDFPYWFMVWTYLRTFRADGTGQRIQRTWRKQVRVAHLNGADLNAH